MNIKKKDLKPIKPFKDYSFDGQADFNEGAIV